MSGITLFRTGRCRHNSLVAVAGCGNRFRLCGLTSTTRECLHACCGTSCRCGHLAGIPAVALCVYIGIHILITAGTGMGSITSFRTGRSSHHSLIVMVANGIVLTNEARVTQVIEITIERIIIIHPFTNLLVGRIFDCNDFCIIYFIVTVGFRRGLIPVFIGESFTCYPLPSAFLCGICCADSVQATGTLRDQRYNLRLFLCIGNGDKMAAHCLAKFLCLGPADNIIIQFIVMAVVSQRCIRIKLIFPIPVSVQINSGKTTVVVLQVTVSAGAPTLEYIAIADRHGQYTIGCIFVSGLCLCEVTCVGVKDFHHTGFIVKAHVSLAHGDNLTDKTGSAFMTGQDKTAIGNCQLRCTVNLARTGNFTDRVNRNLRSVLIGSRLRAALIEHHQRIGWSAAVDAVNGRGVHRAGQGAAVGVKDQLRINGRVDVMGEDLHIAGRHSACCDLRTTVRLREPALKKHILKTRLRQCADGIACSDGQRRGSAGTAISCKGDNITVNILFTVIVRILSASFVVSCNTIR